MPRPEIGNLAANRSRRAHERNSRQAGCLHSRPAPRGPHRAHFYSVEADAARDCFRSSPRRFQHPPDAARGGTADRRADARCVRANAGRIRAGSRGARHRANGKAAPRIARSRVHLLDQPPRAEHGDRALLCGHERRRRGRPNVQQALLEFRPHPAGRLPAAHQSALDRRCPHPRSDALGEKLRRLPIAANRGESWSIR